MPRLRTKQWCNHYRGMHEKEACEAGVRFQKLPGYGAKGFMETCPCFGPSEICGKAEYPTAEEMVAHEADMQARFERIGKARTAIVEHLGCPWKRGTAGSNGKIDCPACGGKETLAFSRAGYNGHIHAACSTDDCVRWME